MAGMRHTMRISMLAILTVLVAEGPSMSQKPPELKADPKLQAPLSGDLSNLKVRDVMDRLRETTMLSIQLGSGVDGDQIAFPIFQLRNVPAWMVMQQLAKAEQVKGRWEKTDGGYSLVSNSASPTAAPLAPDAPESNRFGNLAIMGMGGAGVVVLVLMLWFIRRKVGARTTTNTRAG